MDFKKLIVQSWNHTLNFIGPVLLMTLVQIIVSVISFGILAPVTMAGYVQSLLRVAREGRKPEIGDLFSQMRLFLPLFLFYSAVVLITVIGFMLLILPGFMVICFVAFGSLYLIPLMTDKNLGLFDALKTAWDHAVSPPVTDHLIVAIIYVVVMSLGSSLPFAFLVTQPMATFILVGAYRQKVAQEALEETGADARPDRADGPSGERQPDDNKQE